MVSHEQALDDFALAERLSPTDRFDGAQRLAARAFAALCVGRYEESARFGEAAWRAGGMHGGLFGAAACVALGRLDLAHDRVADVLTRHPDLDMGFLRTSYSYMPKGEKLDWVFELLEMAGVPVSSA